MNEAIEQNQKLLNKFKKFEEGDEEGEGDNN